jgi:hypothetical protein
MWAWSQMQRFLQIQFHSLPVGSGSSSWWELRPEPKALRDQLNVNKFEFWLIFFHIFNNFPYTSSQRQADHHCSVASLCANYHVEEG